MNREDSRDGYAAVGLLLLHTITALTLPQMADRKIPLTFEHYLTGCAHGFRAGYIDVHQLTLAK